MMTIPGKPEILNIGVELFAMELRAQGVEVTSLEWTPPSGDEQAAALAMVETLVDPATEKP